MTDNEKYGWGNAPDEAAMPYIQACNLIISDPDEFKKFRRNPDYGKILSGGEKIVGEGALKSIKELGGYKLFQQNPCNQTGITGQKIRNSSGTVVAVVNSNTGNMYIAGSCFERQSSLNPANAAYVAKDSNGNVIAYINTSGNLYLKGRVYESI